jgi:uncharacterized protein Usg
MRGRDNAILRQYADNATMRYVVPTQKYREHGGPEFPDPELEKSGDRIEYNNRQLTEQLVPAYRRMVDHFRENFWLAEYSTREHFPLLVQFVEKWNRDLAGTFTPELSRRVDVEEKKLYPLGCHVPHCCIVGILES